VIKKLINKDLINKINKENPVLQFSEGLPLLLKTPASIRNPQLKDEIHCVAILVDATHVNSICDEMKKQLMNIIQLCGRKGKRGTIV